MAFETGYDRRLETVVRALSTAHKVLRLYPESSPIPGQSVSSAIAALDHLFAEGVPLLSLAVGRDGLSALGEIVGTGVVGVEDLVTDLRSHGIAELNLAPGCTAAELTRFLALLGRAPEDLRAGGGLAAELVAAGVDSIRVADVRLTVLEQVVPDAEEDVDEFLRGLARDPEKLAVWFAAASGADPRTFEESLMELVRVSGPSGFGEMLEALSVAFCRQEPEAKDALLALALSPGPTRDLAGAMFGLLDPNEITNSIVGGSFGLNMLSLSSALTKLPLDAAAAQVRAEVQAMLPALGRSAEQASFLEHMLEVRSRADGESALADADTTYRAVLAATALDDSVVRRGREAVVAEQRHASSAGVRMMLSLLGQQNDFELFCSSLDSLAGMVPVLVEQGELELTRHVMVEFSRRQALDVRSWPELSARLSAAMAAACGPRTMEALLGSVLEHEGNLPLVSEIVRHGGETAPAALVAQAVALKEPGIAAADKIVGRRLGDLLAQQALLAQWFQLAPIARWLAADGEPRSVQTLDALMKRTDEQSRREIVTGAAEAGGPVAERVLARALRDPSAEVALVAARCLGTCDAPRAAEIIAARLGEIDIDHADFALGRELIGALARCPGSLADDALARLSGRRSIIKRGHFAEVQSLVNRARDHRSQARSMG